MLNLGQGVMQWTVSAAALSGGNWLTVGPTSGSSDAGSLSVPLVEVGVNHAGLAPGDYYGQVQVRAGTADNSPQVITVVLSVLPPGSNPGPLIRPTGLIFAGVAGGASPGSQTFSVSNLLANPTSFISGLVGGARAISYLPTDATVQPQSPTRIAVQPDYRILPAGVHRATLTLQFEDGTPATVSLLLVAVASAGAGGGSSEEALLAEASCVPSRLLPLATGLGPSFQASVGWPVPLEVKVFDDCGRPLVTGTVVASFSNGDPPMSLVSLKDGRWTGTWQPRSVRPQLVITVAAEDPVQRMTGNTQLLGALRADAAPPILSPRAIVSSAAPSTDAPLAPGALVRISGSRLAAGSSAVTAPPLATELAGTSVLIGGASMPLFSVAAGEVLGIVPFGLGVNTRHQVVLFRGSSASAPEPVILAVAQPAVFTQDDAGRQGRIFRPDGTLAEPATSALVGEELVIHCSGLGEVSPAVAAGQAAPADPPSTTVNRVEVKIGDVGAEVVFAGLVPNEVGLYHVRAIVPGGVAAGDQVEVRLTVAGRTSAPVTIAVR